MTIQQLLVVSSGFATWNSNDKGSGVTLSNGDLTANINGRYSVRATKNKSAGKWYWEITVDTNSGNEMIGVADANLPLNNYVGETSASWSYNAQGGKKFNNNIGTAYGAGFTTGDVIGVALDLDAGTLTFYKNGSSQGQAFSGLSGTLYPAVGGLVGSNQTMTANFGATSFSYTPPTGHLPL